MNVTGLTRRSEVAGGLIAAVRARPARAAEFAYRLGSDVAQDDPISTRLNEATEAIRSRSEGRLDIRVIPNVQLGTGPEMLNQLRSGAIQFFPGSSAVLSALIPMVGLPNVAFAFKSYDDVWSGVDGALGQFIRRQIEAQGTLFPMTRMWDVGFRQITTSTREVHAPADLAGLKIRVRRAPSIPRCSPRSARRPPASRSARSTPRCRRGW